MRRSTVLTLPLQLVVPGWVVISSSRHLLKVPPCLPLNYTKSYLTLSILKVQEWQTAFRNYRDKQAWARFLVLVCRSWARFLILVCRSWARLIILACHSWVVIEGDFLKLSCPFNLVIIPFHFIQSRSYDLAWKSRSCLETRVSLGAYPRVKHLQGAPLG